MPFECASPIPQPQVTPASQQIISWHSVAVLLQRCPKAMEKPPEQGTIKAQQPGQPKTGLQKLTLQACRKITCTWTAHQAGLRPLARQCTVPHCCGEQLRCFAASLAAPACLPLAASVYQGLQPDFAV